MEVADDLTHLYRRVDRAVVPVAARVSHPDLKMQWWLSSGFVAETQGRWFWITADHTFNSYRYRNATGLDFLNKTFPAVEPRLWPISDPLHAGLPVNFEKERIISMPDLAARLDRSPLPVETLRHEHIRSLDIAVWELSPFYIAQLRACNVEPLKADEVFREYDEQFIEEVVRCHDEGRLTFYVVGTPQEDVVCDPLGNLESFSLKWLAIWPKDLSRPELVFTPEWAAETHRGSVKGVSGGPAFALLDSRLYWFGVQVGENIERKTVSIAHSIFMFRVLEAIVYAYDSERRQTDKDSG